MKLLVVSAQALAMADWPPYKRRLLTTSAISGSGETIKKDIKVLTKTLLVMKLTAIFLMAAVLQVSAKGTAQTVTYTAKAESLAKVFSVIEEQTGYAFFLS